MVNYGSRPKSASRMGSVMGREDLGKKLYFMNQAGEKQSPFPQNQNPKRINRTKTVLLMKFGPETEEKLDLTKQTPQNVSARYARRSARSNSSYIRA